MNGLRKQRLFFGALLLISMVLYNFGQDWSLWIVYLLIAGLLSSAFFNFCPSDSFFCPLGDKK